VHIVDLPFVPGKAIGICKILRSFTSRTSEFLRVIALVSAVKDLA
jgi:hypothetical protein